jgi:hypothetical protein
MSDYRIGRPGLDPRQRQRAFSSSLYGQTDSEALSASYAMGSEVLSPRVKFGQGVTLTTNPI